MKSISELYAGLTDPGLPARQTAEHMQFAQQEAFFYLAAAKTARIESLRADFSQAGIRKVCLSANLAGFDPQLAGIQIEVLEPGFFADTAPASREQKLARLRGAVVIVNNNDVGHGSSMPAYADFYARCDQTAFIGWDWDNHHWLETSTFLAAHCDIYAPAHHENLYLLTRYNNLTAGPIYCATVQWSKDFLTEHIAELIREGRSSAPLGMHIPYSPFTFRNRVIATLNQHFPTIGFSDRSFHGRTAEDRFKEWCGHKSHWIVPVLNDVPIRIFDALVTGGIPIVPDALRLLPPVNGIDEQDIVFYGPGDIINPTRVAAEANTKFEAGGQRRIIFRHRYALEHHHGEERVARMIGALVKVLGLPRQKYQASVGDFACAA